MMEIFSESENRFRFAQYILRNGYTPKTKIEMLEKIGIDLPAIRGDSQEEYYEESLRRLNEKF